MKSLRKTAWLFALALALTVIGIPQLSLGQSREGMEHGRGHDKDRGRGQKHDNDVTRNPNYQRGIVQGQNDGARNRAQQYRGRFNNDGDRRAYQAGYDKGFQDGRAQYASRGDNDDRRRQAPYGQNGQYGRNQNGQYNSQAARMGAQDGLNDGRSDRQTGHSSRVTEGDNYKDALRGYNSSFGGETAYKAAYRQAYGPAYQQGYNNQGYRR